MSGCYLVPGAVALVAFLLWAATWPELQLACTLCGDRLPWWRVLSGADLCAPCYRQGRAARAAGLFPAWSAAVLAAQGLHLRGAALRAQVEGSLAAARRWPLGREAGR